MSYEMMRFGWQKLLVNQVPQKGGRRGAPAISGPPPRDWSPEWNQVTTAGKAAATQLDEISKIFSTAGGAATFTARQSEINAKIASTTSQIDQALALNGTIPASWFGDKLADRNAAIASLQQTRSNLNRYIGNWQPTQFDLVSDEVDRQLLVLASQNRVLKGPIIPLPIDGSYPSGSWQHAMWGRGYASHEISWVEEEISRDPVILAAANDYEFYKKLIEDKIQDGIIGGKIPAPEYKEFVQPLPARGLLPNPALVGDGFIRTPTGPIEGIGNYTGGPVVALFDPVYGEDGVTYSNIMSVPKGIRWSRKPWIIDGNKVTPDGDTQVGIGNYTGGPVLAVYDPVYGEDGVTYSNSMSVPKGIRWSRKPWRENSVSQDIRFPSPPRGIVPGTREYQVWLRRQTRKPIASTPGKPGVVYCDKPGWNTPPSIELPRPLLPRGEIDSMPRCGTGVVTGRPWEAAMIGEGCTVSHLDTIRKFFMTAKLAPNADQIEIARTICTRLRNQDNEIPNVITVNPIDIGQSQGVNFTVLDANGVAVTDIPGVRQMPVSPRTIAAQNLAARRQASRVRRGAFK